MHKVGRIPNSKVTNDQRDTEKPRKRSTMNILQENAIIQVRWSEQKTDDWTFFFTKYLLKRKKYVSLQQDTTFSFERPNEIFNMTTEERNVTSASCHDMEPHKATINFHLNTTSARSANAIAGDVREAGRPMREGNLPTGAIIYDDLGQPMMKPGTLKCTEAFGRYIDECGIAVLTMDITDLDVTPIHKAFDEVCRSAQNRGIRVVGTEIVGAVAKKTLIEAGKHFLEKQHRSIGIPEDDIIKIAIKSMGLDILKPFNIRKQVIEYLLEDEKGENEKAPQKLVDLTVKAFTEDTTRERPAPSGGTIAAYMGTLAAALGTMVANLSSAKFGWDERWQEFSDWAAMGQDLTTHLLRLTDEDAIAYNRLKAAIGMPNVNEQEKALRAEAIQKATLYAAQVPLRTMKAAMQAFIICKAMAKEGNSANASDAGIGALAARAAVIGAGLKVKINAAQLKDRSKAKELITEAQDLINRSDLHETEIMDIVNDKLTTGYH
ncbi:MAG: cyclodeaminase/cyclohydrolase family protein [Prevotella sp.]|nr:cyclodeaminase/cyclohydrolase family protein [Prevotella sp.]